MPLFIVVKSVVCLGVLILVFTLGAVISPKYQVDK